jgi:hypothetical protein
VAEHLDAFLLEQFRRLQETHGEVRTLSNGNLNEINAVDYEGVWITTKASSDKGTGAQLVPAWMLNIAWRHLQDNGSLTNAHLLSSGGLNVKRSSAVCALLSQLPGVRIVSTRPIRLVFE